MKHLKFELTLDEANLVLTSLSKLPYEATFAIIEKLKGQATSQLVAAKVAEAEAEAEVVEVL